MTKLDKINSVKRGCCHTLLNKNKINLSTIVEINEDKIMENVKTLQDFADLINSTDEWLPIFFEIIEENGWTDECYEYWGVCSNGTERIVMTESGEAVVRTIEPDEL